MLWTVSHPWLHEIKIFKCFFFSIQKKAFAYIAPQPRIQPVEQEPKLFSSPVDEVIVSIDENVTEAAAEPDGIALDERLQDWKNDADEMKM